MERELRLRCQCASKDQRRKWGDNCCSVCTVVCGALPPWRIKVLITTGSPKIKIKPANISRYLIETIITHKSYYINPSYNKKIQ